MVKLTFDEKREKQRASTDNLEKLVKAFKIHDNHQSTEALLLQLGISSIEFKKHLKTRETFEECESNGETYNYAVKLLQDKSLAKLGKEVVDQCRKHMTSKYKNIRKQAFLQKSKYSWIPPTFKASRPWCSVIKRQITGTREISIADQELHTFVSSHLRNEAEMDLTVIVKKYKELYPGKTYKKRERYLSRFRKKYKFCSSKNDSGKWCWKKIEETN